MTTSLVTGATRGVGREVARRLVEAGHTVYLGARDEVRGADAASAVGATPIALDVADETSIATAVDRVRAEAGSLDVLVNNAGISGQQRPPTESTIEDLRTVFETNVFGAAAVIKAFVPLLEASATPVVVNVSSGVGSLTLNSRPESRWKLLAYPMSKAALNMLTIQYAHAYPRWRINSATPGLTATEFTANTADGVTAEQMAAAGVHVNTVEEGADIIVRMALLGPDGPTVTFIGNGGPIPW
jgi:NAD(P)-dependent dehydrogenase (short-subunit alcohol dehydrogenase family)